ncbi:MAG: glutaredoxin domain-containing protein [Candidatus Roizmanbacteria bacterium]
MIKLYGASWCPDCIKSKKLLSDLKVPYTYINLEEVPEAAETVEKLNNGLQSLPTIVFDDNSTLTEPSDAQLKSKLIEIGAVGI